jgi:hypothetical protein
MRFLITISMFLSVTAAAAPLSTDRVQRLLVEAEFYPRQVVNGDWIRPAAMLITGLAQNGLDPQMDPATTEWLAASLGRAAHEARREDAPIDLVPLTAVYARLQLKLAALGVPHEKLPPLFAEDCSQRL